MKILIIKNKPATPNLKSANNQEIGLARALINKKNEVGIVYFTNEKYHEVELDGITIYYIPGKKILNYALYDKRLYDLCDKYDIIQTAEYNQIMSYRLSKKYSNKVVIYHGPYYRKYYLSIINNMLFDLFYLRRYLKLQPRIIAKSKLAEEFLTKKGFKNVKTLGVGLDDNSLKTGSFNKDIVNTFKKDKINLCCIGLINKRKNQLFLLKVLKELIKKDNRYHLTFLGKPDEKYKKKCLKYIRKNNLDDYVTFMQKINQDEIINVYKNIDVLVHAATYEIFGMILLEAMYFDVPIVTNYNGGASYLLNEDSVVTGLDIDEYVNKILKIKKPKYNKQKLLWEDKVNEFLKFYNNHSK